MGESAFSKLKTTVVTLRVTDVLNAKRGDREDAGGGQNNQGKLNESED